MVYGHGTGDSQKGLPGNVFYYQTLKANEVFGMLDGKQRKAALLDKAPREDEFFQVLAGTFRFRCGDAVYEGGAGTAARPPAPAGTTPPRATPATSRAYDRGLNPYFSPCT